MESFFSDAGFLRSSAETMTKLARKASGIGLMPTRTGALEPNTRWPRVRLPEFDAGDFERNDLIVKQSHNPADGTNEFHATFAGPVHGFRKL